MPLRSISLLLAVAGFCSSLLLPAQAAAQDHADAAQEQAENQALSPWLREAEALFAAYLQDQARPAHAAAWRQAGYQVSSRLDPYPHWLIEPLEAEGPAQGRFLIPRQFDGQVLVQVPHRFSDLHTEEMANRWLKQGLSFALAVNTRHRRGEDLAAEPNSLFTAFARAFALSFPRGRVVQLHGFDPERRHSAAGRDALLIVSAGSRWPTPEVVSLKQCLSRTMAGVALYPEEVSELGGTRNATGRHLRALGHGGFIHLEASRQLRERWLDDERLSREVWQCL